ncbi:CatB-related O-acetyltransferase [Pseudomonas extremorientalis]|jgi:chloramphenicol O-acetyltransferase type B|uniref:CatB-related O-acetyltransferase n=1 Tax=Pseudomonas extremorientalis TaxID=169669 RepID=UPI0027345243|nr:CatB-related O-acetyltransferase [Pseudomonas extremorientalis]WLG57753.1 CatB-related O-acetyltransferase [Pseudomonas extremorientalis]
MKKIIKRIKNSYWQRYIKSHNRKLSSGVASLKDKTTLVLEEHVSLGHIRIDTPNLFIGARTYVRSGSVLSVVSSIGRYCSIGSNCVIGQEKYTHPTDWISTHPFQFEGGILEYKPVLSGVTIGHDVWIGHGAMIMEGVQVGTGAIVAAQALVTRDVPPYAVVAGNPAKIVRYRHSEDTIERLLRSGWWERDISWLRDLPLNDPQSCLPLLERECASSEHTANFNKMEITSKSCKVFCQNNADSPQ